MLFRYTLPMLVGGFMLDASGATVLYGRARGGFGSGNDLSTNGYNKYVVLAQFLAEDEDCDSNDDSSDTDCNDFETWGANEDDLEDPMWCEGMKWETDYVQPLQTGILAYQDRGRQKHLDLFCLTGCSMDGTQYTELFEQELLGTKKKMIADVLQCDQEFDGDSDDCFVQTTYDMLHSSTMNISAAVTGLQQKDVERRRRRRQRRLRAGAVVVDDDDDEDDKYSTATFSFCSDFEDMAVIYGLGVFNDDDLSTHIGSACGYGSSTSVVAYNAKEDETTSDCEQVLRRHLKLRRKLSHKPSLGRRRKLRRRLQGRRLDKHKTKTRTNSL